MKLFLASILTLFIFNISQAASPEANRLLGTYYTYKNKSKVIIYEENGKFFGKIIWLLDPSKKDDKNPDSKEHTKSLMNKVILKDFTYKGKDVWGGGTIYDPHSGHTYTCKIKMRKNGDLDVRGYIGISLIGKTTEWTKVSD